MRLLQLLNKEHLDRHLPRHHQYLLATLTSLLIALTFFPKAESNQRSADDFIALGPLIPAGNASFDPIAALLAPASEPDSRLWLEVKPGDSLSVLFQRAGLGAQQVIEVTADSEQAQLLTRLHPGDNLAFQLTPDAHVQSLELVKTPLESWLLTRQDTGGYTLEHLLKEPEVRPVWREVQIDGSLFLSAQRNDISAALAMDLSNIFSGVVDFMQDTKTGDSFGVLYEELYLDGQYVGQGRILAAEYTSGGQTRIALRYENSDGDSSFYSPQGESMSRAFLLNPVDFTRISSGFNP
ncbi:MAG: hypothetical protein LBE21_01550, partial [Pseudomonadales bacterium]|nr:hypothetical protein [Pseudomonadales bacterium]